MSQGTCFFARAIVAPKHASIYVCSRHNDNDNEDSDDNNNPLFVSRPDNNSSEDDSSDDESDKESILSSESGYDNIIDREKIGAVDTK